MKLRVGDWVVVKSKEDILWSLDKQGRLEGLPFMPQMFQYCGQRFQVYKRAHKTCDTVGYYRGGGRGLSDGVHLDLRCDGEAYGGCQAACLIFWKDAWLQPVDQEAKQQADSANAKQCSTAATSSNSCTEENVWAGTSLQGRQAEEDIIYTCQATELPNFTTFLPWWNLSQYLEDYTSGNVFLRQMFDRFLFAVFFNLYEGLTRIWWRFSVILAWIYDKFQAMRGGFPFPCREGTIPEGQPTPTSNLDLQPGELVRVKSYQEILATLDTGNKNRGLVFDQELVPYCGGTYRVRARLNKFIDEKTGKMLVVKNTAILLEDVWCRSRYSGCRLFCPRSIYSWWREVWLERIP